MASDPDCREVYLLSFGRIYCAQLHHDNDQRYISHHREEREEPPVSGSGQRGHEPVRTNVRATLG
jgi:hypothetical protein